MKKYLLSTFVAIVLGGFSVTHSASALEIRQVLTAKLSYVEPNVAYLENGLVGFRVRLLLMGDSDKCDLFCDTDIIPIGRDAECKMIFDAFQKASKGSVVDFVVVNHRVVDVNIHQPF